MSAVGATDAEKTGDDQQQPKAKSSPKAAPMKAMKKKANNQNQQKHKQIQRPRF